MFSIELLESLNRSRSGLGIVCNADNTCCCFRCEKYERENTPVVLTYKSIEPIFLLILVSGGRRVDFTVVSPINFSKCQLCCDDSDSFF